MAAVKAAQPSAMPAIAPDDKTEDDFAETGMVDVAVAPALPTEALDVKGEVEGDAGLDVADMDDEVLGVVDVADEIDEALVAELDSDTEGIGFDEADEAVFRTTTLGLETC